MKKYFFKQPKSTTSFPKDNYLVQQKYDGERMLFIDKGINNVLLNRRYVNKNKQYPEFAKTHLPNNTILDGEMVVFDSKGRDSFNLLSRRTHLKYDINEMSQKYPATYMAFDILRYKNQPLYAQPLTQRLTMLKKIPQANNIKLVKTYPLSQAKKVLQPRHIEGIIFKQADSSYEDVKDNAWLKYKKQKEADLVVTGYKEGEGKRKGMVGAVYVGVWDKHDIKPMGKVGSFKNMEEQDLIQLRQELNKYKTHEHKGDILVKPKMFVKVAYDSMGTQGRLRTPRVIGVRKDISIKDTHLSQPVSDETTKNGGNLFWGEMAQHGIDIGEMTSREKKFIRRTYEKNPELLNKSQNISLIPINYTGPKRHVAGTLYKAVGMDDAKRYTEIIPENQREHDIIGLSKELFNKNEYDIKKHTKRDVMGAILAHELKHREDAYNPEYIKNEEAERKARDIFNKQLETARRTRDFLSEAQKEEGNLYFDTTYRNFPSEKRANIVEMQPRERDVQVAPEIAAKHFGSFYQRIEKKESPDVIVTTKIDDDKTKDRIFLVKNKNFRELDSSRPEFTHDDLLELSERTEPNFRRTIRFRTNEDIVPMNIKHPENVVQITNVNDTKEFSKEILENKNKYNDFVYGLKKYIETGGSPEAKVITHNIAGDRNVTVGNVSDFIEEDNTEDKKRNKIVALAYRLKQILTPLSYKVNIAGSIRRGAEPKDIDIVLIPKDKEKIKERMEKLGAKVTATGDTLHYSSINGVHVDIFFAERDSYGAQMMTRTGPAGGNIGNRQLAKRKGMLLNQYGLFKGDKRIAGKTEKEIYEALGKHYKEPQYRGKTEAEIRRDESKDMAFMYPTEEELKRQGLKRLTLPIEKVYKLRAGYNIPETLHKSPSYQEQEKIRELMLEEYKKKHKLTPEQKEEHIKLWEDRLHMGLLKPGERIFPKSRYWYPTNKQVGQRWGEENKLALEQKTGYTLGKPKITLTKYGSLDWVTYPYKYTKEQLEDLYAKRMQPEHRSSRGFDFAQTKDEADAYIKKLSEAIKSDKPLVTPIEFERWEIKNQRLGEGRHRILASQKAELKKLDVLVPEDVVYEKGKLKFMEPLEFEKKKSEESADVVVTADVGKNKEKQYIELRPKLNEDKYYYLYHGTPIYNKEKILQQGILPKTATGGLKEVEEILHKHNIPKTKETQEIWKYPQHRLEQTKSHIHLSSDYDYALQNSLATYEAKNELEAELWRRQHPHATNKEYWEQVVKKRFQPNSAIFLVRVPKEKFTSLSGQYDPSSQDDIVLDKIPPQDVMGYTIEKRRPWWPHSPPKVEGRGGINVTLAMKRIFKEPTESSDVIVTTDVAKEKKKFTMEKEQDYFTQMNEREFLGMRAPVKVSDRDRIRLAIGKPVDADLDKAEKEYWAEVMSRKPISKEMPDIFEVKSIDVTVRKQPKIFSEETRDIIEEQANVGEPVTIPISFRKPRERKEYQFIPEKEIDHTEDMWRCIICGDIQESKILPDKEGGGHFHKWEKLEENKEE